MNKGLEVINSLLDSGVIRLEDFYHVSFDKYDLKFQGNYNSYVVERFIKSEGADVEVDKSGFININFKHLDFKVIIVMT